MIKIEFVTALSISLCISMMIIYGIWLVSQRGKEEMLTPSQEYVHQCPYCTFVFVTFKKEEAMRCPRCKSLIGTEKNDELPA